jgi:hypothetical protein
MNMSNYEIERDLLETEYGDEVLYASWNPAVALMCQQQVDIRTNRQTPMPAEFASVDAASFLQKMYAYQR